jgi:hypothetical protein
MRILLPNGVSVAPGGGERTTPVTAGGRLVRTGSRELHGGRAAIASRSNAPVREAGRARKGARQPLSLGRPQ